MMSGLSCCFASESSMCVVANRASRKSPASFFPPATPIATLASVYAAALDRDARRPRRLALAAALAMAPRLTALPRRDALLATLDRRDARLDRRDARLARRETRLDKLMPEVLLRRPEVLRRRPPVMLARRDCWRATMAASRRARGLMGGLGDAPRRDVDCTLAVLFRRDATLPASMLPRRRRLAVDPLSPRIGGPAPALLAAVVVPPAAPAPPASLPLSPLLRCVSAATPANCLNSADVALAV